VQKYESAGINLKKEKVEEGNNAKKWKWILDKLSDK
jgi:hypothetical protein